MPPVCSGRALVFAMNWIGLALSVRMAAMTFAESLPSPVSTTNAP